MKKTPRYQRDLKYWVNKLTFLSNNTDSQTHPPAKGVRKRLEGSLTKQQWDVLKTMSVDLGTSPTALLLTIFSAVIATLHHKERFPIILTVYNRLPLHKQVADLIGPFISTSIFVRENTPDHSLKETCRNVQKQLFEDLDHYSVSGIRALRELKVNHGLDHSMSIPYVFTSTINLDTPSPDEKRESWYDKATFSVTQTPQVYLDHQVAEKEGRLVFSWDVVEDFFPPGAIKAAFSNYCQALKRFGESPDAWESSPLTSILDKPGEIPPQAAGLDFPDQLDDFVLQTDPENPHTPFSLTDQQQAYLLGRTDYLSGGPVSCAAYQEFKAVDLDVERLNQAWLDVISTHDMLRATIKSSGSQQIIESPREYTIKTYDHTKLSDKLIIAKLEEIRSTITNRLCPLDQWPFFELSVSKLKAGEYRIHFAIDLLIADVTSINRLLKQLFLKYEHPETPLLKPALSFRDYRRSQDTFKRTPAYQHIEHYWERKFAELPSGPCLPLRNKPSETRPPQQARLEAVLPNWGGLREKADQYSVSPSMILLAAYCEVISCWTNHDPFTIVIPCWDRVAVHPDIDQVVGDFTALCWVASANPALSFREKIRHYHDLVQKDLAHSIVSGLTGLRKTARRDPKGNMLSFPWVFTNLVKQADTAYSDKFQPVMGSSVTPQVQVDNISVEIGDRLQLHWDVIQDTFAENLIEEMFAGYRRLLDALSTNPDQWNRPDFDELLKSDHLNPGPTASKESTQAVPAEWNETDKHYPSDKCLHHYIEQQVQRSPSHMAVCFEDQTLSYQQLNERANRMAHYIRNKGLAPDQAVGVMMERSVEMVVALLAVLKAGGAYLPLDPTYPPERLDFILGDASVSMVLTQQKFQPVLNRFSGDHFCLDTQWDRLSNEPTSNPTVTSTPDDLAYVIYTSGSTGQPKGCMLPHKAICNRLFWMQDKYALTDKDNVLQKTPFTFDVSVWEFFWPLLTGACLVAAKPGGHQDNRYLVNLIKEQNITVCHFVPSMLSFFLNELSVGQCLSLKQVFTSGEALSYPITERFRQKLSATLHNLYGPTEAAVDVSYWECEQRTDKLVPIGRPIANIRLYILDEALQPVDIGVEGELHIGGIGLAKGYLNRPELTRETFIPNPFGPDRLYKTGDKARYLPDGNIEYLGRIDFQVKVRGNRIELPEIETVLLEHPNIAEAAVLVKDEQSDDPKLVAYLVTHKDALTLKEVRDFAALKLPAYMLPNRLASVDGMPVTQHGKLDRKALPWPLSQLTDPPRHDQPDHGHRHADIVNSVRSYLKEVLDLKEIHEEADLFDLGATSYTIVQLAQRLSDQEQIDIAIDAFLESPTLSNITTLIQENRPNPGPSVETNPAPLEENRKEPVNSPKKSAVIDSITSFLTEVLDLKEIDQEADLFDLGATSYTIVQLAQHLVEQEQVTIPVEVILDSPTLKTVAAYIRETVTDPLTPETNCSPAEATPPTTGSCDEKEDSDTLPLPSISLRTDDYESMVNEPDFGDESLSFEQFSRFLSLLKEQTVGDESKYLYPTAGGLNAVQTYVYVKEGAVESINEGLYYHHPINHTLHRIHDKPRINADIYHEYHRTTFEQAGFCLFFMARLEAIQPVYGGMSDVLAALDTGYMIQLLMSRHPEFGMGLRSVIGIDFESVRPDFKLNESDIFIGGMLGGTAQKNGPTLKNDPRSNLVEYLQTTGTNLTAHYKTDNPHTSYMLGDYAKKPGDVKFMLKETQDAFKAAKHQLRRDIQSDGAIRLKTTTFHEADYLLRSSLRNYPQRTITRQQLSGFLALLKFEQINGRAGTLYQSIGGMYAIDAYLYVKKDRVEGVPEGVYQYDPLTHGLILKSDIIKKKVKPSHTPFNRFHYQKSAFSLFLIVDQDVPTSIYGSEGIKAAALEAGCMGQVLMDHQSEFNMGICPIGGLRFERIRENFKLQESQELLHSFTCGFFEHPALEHKRRFLTASREHSVAPAQPLKQDDQDLSKRPTVIQEMAIIGLSGRYPGAETLHEFWANLKAGNCSIAELPEERRANRQSPDLDTHPEPEKLPRGGFLRSIDRFDSLLFKISPLEARSMDPQERLFLETVWECLENAGYTGQSLNERLGRVGVFVGAMWSDYSNTGMKGWQQTGSLETTSFHSGIANRVSHFFNFQGPSLAVDTSCSSALTAIHMACESIKRGECDMAVAGGVNIIAHPCHQDLLSDLNLTSKNGKSHAFGADADGWVAGEGVGAILIVPKQTAEENGDSIHGVIKGSLIRHIGRSVRYGAPNTQSWTCSIKDTFKQCGIEPGSIRHIEAAAPGAGIADSSEMASLADVFNDQIKPGDSWSISSIKPNIGHLESASVMSQLTKVLFQIKDRKVAPSINCDPTNPFIPFNEIPFTLVKELSDWEPAVEHKNGGKPHRALINAFGATGSVGHLVIEEYIDKRQFKPPAVHPNLILLSAATQEQVIKLANRLLDYLHAPDQTTPEVSLISFTLRVGREAMTERLAIVCTDLNDLKVKLDGFISGNITGDDVIFGTADMKLKHQELSDKEDVMVIARQWTKGLTVRWSDAHEPGIKRIPLPTYPFLEERYWVEEPGYDRIGTEISAGQNPRPSQSLQTERIADSPNTDRGVIATKTMAYLKGLFSTASEIPVSKIGDESVFEDLGISSIMITQLNTLLEKAFPNLPRTLFYEVTNMRELADYFLREHSNQLVNVLNLELPEKTEGSLRGALSAGRTKNRLNEPLGRLPDRNSSDGERDKIAIIGLSGRYPKAETINEFWNNLKEGRDCIEEVPHKYWNVREHFDSDPNNKGKIYCKWGGFMDDVDMFDPLFFNMSPLQAEATDPQSRLFLEIAWEVIEDGGYGRDTLKRFYNGEVGVFVGVMYGEYQLYSMNEPDHGSTVLLDSSYGSIANRVSYFMDFSGPSLAVDTMCSSSLTALHLAVESILRDECRLAIAGGVNVSIHPNKYLVQSTINMSSTDGRCRSFGAGGDGIVPGEGVGAVLLKPLGPAINDHDRIYGVIRGTSINHGGKTSGYTVPNPNAQAKLIIEALNRSDTNPRMISYVEAHGTGTSLGDPIEIRGLGKAFGRFTQDKQYCSIGSVKSNIGHLESAAGIAGITKILLQMKHKKLVPSIHSEELNPNIDFSNSPFRVQQTLTDWKQPTPDGEKDRTVSPRIAAISSFGAGGANGHVIIEEYIPEQEAGSEIMITSDNPAMIILSAKSNDGLAKQVERLLTAIKENDFQACDLPDIAYTLQVGREAMEERLGVIVGSLKELEEKLKGFQKGNNGIDNLYRGRAKANQDGMSFLTADEDMQYTIDAWITKGKHDKLLELWVKGFVFDWTKLYGKIKPKRISLPTYPFAKERYWIPDTHPQKTGANAGSTVATIHPLLHQNTSELSEQRFSSTFSGREFFLNDHRLNGQKVLPPVCYLEMAGAAVEKAGGPQGEGTSLQLKNVVWSQPITVNSHDKEVHIALFEETEDRILYEVYTSPDNEEEVIVHSQGVAEFKVDEAVPGIDIETLKSQMNQEPISVEAYYQTFKTMGINYGPGLQAIREIYRGENQILANLILPAAIQNTLDEYVLHPSLMDAALQSSLGLQTASTSNPPGLKPCLPFALESLEVLGSCGNEMLAWIRYSGESTLPNKVQKLDIDLCDPQGNVRVKMRGLETQEITESRILEESATEKLPDNRPREETQLLYFEEVWQEEECDLTTPKTDQTLLCFLSDPKLQEEFLHYMRSVSPKSHVIFVSQEKELRLDSSQHYSIDPSEKESYIRLLQAISKADVTINAIVYLWPVEDSGWIKDMSPIVWILQSLKTVHLNVKDLLLVGEANNLEEESFLESWIGFERSSGMIFPQTKVRVLLSSTRSASISMHDWASRIWNELREIRPKSVRYQGKERLVSQIRRLQPESNHSLIKSGGTYLITGGCGGLGILFGRYLVDQYQANLILTGRSPLSADTQKLIQPLQRPDNQVVYVQADISDLKTMKQALTQAVKKAGAVKGIIHAAGLEGKQTLFEKEFQDFARVLSPKVQGTLNLEHFFKEESLDFICCFSSSSAILGDFGSCDYAVANRFQTAYSRLLTEAGVSNVKRIVVNWPLWKEGGMAMGQDENTRFYLETSGQEILTKQQGLPVFEHLISSKAVQTLVLLGQPKRIERFLGITREPGPASAPQPLSSQKTGRTPDMRGLSVEQCVIGQLKDSIHRLLKVPENRLGMDVNLSDFGFDSISLTAFSRLLSDVFALEITPALFFDCTTLAKLTRYLMDNHQDVLQKLYREDVPGNGSVIPKVQTASSKRNLFRSKRRAAVPNSRQDKIAIIGMSGRFPQAENVEELWKLLVEGKEAVQEIPPERFDWKAYYDESGSDGGLTSKWCGTIEGVSEFDPLFFEISPREAEPMDPRQRLLLQESWKALEDAGYGKSHLDANRIGMFVGVEQGDYQFLTGTGSVTSNHNAILATRLAYFLDLNGPAMAIDTACSSGLVAAHQACMSLKNKECDTAIAAGVNLLLTPELYILMSQAGMLSKDGKCFAFDKRANGMVPAEAVAVVVFKPLNQAEADGDPIYGVIRGSGINYDGKTNGITAPSGTAQKELLTGIYSQVQVNPEDIQYIVTHGTGTKLGDPVEINALYNAFKGHTPKTGYCALTSTKTNLGHSFAASGVVSLISLVQALRYQTIPGSLHCEEENDYIQWDQSPFYVNKKTRKWPQPDRKKRLGAVSAFGMSGTNAHMLVEEYQMKRLREHPAPPVTLLVFSARTAESLLERLDQMRLFLESEQFQDDSLVQTAYTLLMGRHHFKHRLALVVKDKEMAVSSLQRVLAGEKPPYRFKNKVPREFAEQKAIKRYIGELLEKSRSLISDPVQYQETLYGLGELYCQGYEIDGTLLFKNSMNRRMHLPTYPFAKERYWISKAHHQKTGAKAGSSLTTIHPLLHQNTSDLEEQRFSSTFSGQEFFLNDHRVNGQKVLPGVCYLEMAGVAVKKSSRRQEEGTSLQLKNIVWARPIIVDNSAKEVHIALLAETAGRVRYEVYTAPDSEIEEEVIVHSQGVAEFKVNEAIPALDIDGLKSQMNQGILNGATCYQTFETMGFGYGPGHQAIREIHRGENQILAHLILPSSIQNTLGQYVLHPGLLDSALQSAIGLSPDSTFDPHVLKPILPFALESLEITGSCTGEMFAWVRYSQGSTPSDTVQKLDMDLCDTQGNVRARMRGFSSRVLDRETGPDRTKQEVGTLSAIPIWKETPMPAGIEGPAYSDHRVILCELQGVTANEVESLVSGSVCWEWESAGQSLESRFTEYAVRCFESIQEILKQKPPGNVLIQIVTPYSGDRSLFAGLSGLLKTAHLENSKVIGQLIQIDGPENNQSLAKKLEENRNTPYESAVRYVREKRFVSTSEEATGLTEQPEIVFKEDGVYLITGGLGGLGIIFAKEILKQTREATIILTGRSDLTAEKESLLKELQAEDRQVTYQKIDVSNLEPVLSLIESIQNDTGKLTGIIHSAGIVSDNFILKKTNDEFRRVLAPKVNGVMNLDQATHDVTLDFFVLFSSIAGAMGNIGQADYAAANAFMDQFATYRNDLVVSNERTGQTLSINWPLWKEGGMKVDAATEEMLKVGAGMTALETEAGIEAFYHGLALKQGRLMVMAGDLRKIRQISFSETKSPLPPERLSKATPEETVVDKDSLVDKLQKMLVQTVSKTLRLGAEDIDLDAELSEFGFDSITLTDFSNRLNRKYSLELIPTLFYEYPTLGGFARYLSEEHENLFASHFKSTVKAGVAKPVEILDGEEPARTAPTNRGFRFSARTPILETPAESNNSVAIIGMSGTFPMAADIDRFWENLKAGKDSITEIPSDRWDWKEWYGDPHTEANKTNIKWGGFIDGVGDFDPLFFGISPREAELMDPQQRLLMTHAYRAIEDAGYSPSSLSGSDTGVFVGTAAGSYSNLVARSGNAIEGYTMTGLSGSVGPNRLSYFLNLHGPSEPIETACSSSLVAIHRATQVMNEGNCHTAIAGGVNTIITPETHIGFNKAGMLCEDGRCKTFSSKADGYVRGEGVGILFLKTLSHAESDGDHIYAVIRGSSENHGGKANSLTAPNPKAQAELLKTAYTKAGIDPKTVSYIEAHGTGTELGDPIEINGLKTAFKALYAKAEDSPFSDTRCGVGSVKSNIGHLELAAGAAGVIKVLLQLKHKTLVKTLHCPEQNPYIDLKDTPFYIVQENREWVALKDGAGNDIPRRAGVSSFGFGGVNAHIVLEEYTSQHAVSKPVVVGSAANSVIVPLSAKNRDRLDEAARNLLRFLQNRPSADTDDSDGVTLLNLSYTLQVGREAMEERLGLIVNSVNELEEKLEGFLEGKDDIDDCYRGQVKRSQDNLSVITADDDMQNTIGAWIAKGKHAKLLGMWVKGWVFDWNKLYGEIKPNRMSLPTYPFAKDRYWVFEDNQQKPIESDNDPFDSEYYGKLIDDVLKTKEVLN